MTFRSSLFRAVRRASVPAAAILLALSVSAAEPGAGGTVNFSFDAVDVQAFVKLVGEITGRHFVVDSGVQGKITVLAPKVPRDQVYPLFVSIIESAGCSVIEERGVTRVVSMPGRAVPPVPVIGPDEATPEVGIITKIIALRNVRADAVARALQGASGGGGKSGGPGIAAIDETNHLLVTDTGSNVRRLERIIAELDVPGASRVTEVVPLRFASAEEIADQINLAVSERDTRAAALTRRLPAPPGTSSSRPEDYGAFAVASPHSNSILLVGSAPKVRELRDLVSKMDVDAESGRGRLNAIFLKYVSAQDAAKNITALLDKSSAKAPQTERRRVAIEASPENNALLVDASPGDFDVVRKLVDQLDRLPNQVHIDVTIIEHTLSDDLDVGVEMVALDLNSSPNEPGVAASSRLGDGADSVLNLVQQGLFPRGLTVGVVAGTRVGADGKAVPNIPAMLSLNALKKEGRFKVLSHTSLESQDNKEASVSIVNEIPILKSTIEGGSGTSRDVIQNIERVDVGIKLKLTPHVIGEEVRMTLNPSIEAVIDPGPSGTAFAPTIAKREVSTTVTVGNERTIVIAGLTRQDENRIERRVPILGRIPLLGRLFRHDISQKEETNLLILVTPKIMADRADSDRVLDDWSRRTGLNPNEKP
ncbi:MAG: type II secretion system protein GspD [Lentisphaerae bacterium]|nr:type II secretion system protein GspD [Lentisphaerota bacterium]